MGKQEADSFKKYRTLVARVWRRPLKSATLEKEIVVTLYSPTSEEHHALSREIVLSEVLEKQRVAYDRLHVFIDLENMPSNIVEPGNLETFCLTCASGSMSGLMILMQVAERVAIQNGAQAKWLKHREFSSDEFKVMPRVFDFNERGSYE